MPTSEEVKKYFDGVARQWGTIPRDFYGVEVIAKSVAAAGLGGASYAPDQARETSEAQAVVVTPGTTGTSGVDADVIHPGSRRRHAQARLLVDVGCGTGFLAEGLAPLATRVIGVDNSERMLEVARENLDALGLWNVELRQSSVENLPVDIDMADAVFANMVLHHAPDPQRILSEMVRVDRVRERFD
jgi:SAM-dependent methyltransferase